MNCKETADSLIANDVVMQRLVYLYGRWCDEHEYEDINDYLTNFKQLVPDAIKAHKRPFGFSVQCDDGVMVFEVKAKGSNVVIGIVFKR